MVQKFAEPVSAGGPRDERRGRTIGNRRTDRARRLFSRAHSEERPWLVSFHRRPQPVAAACEMAANGADREPHRLSYVLIGFTLDAGEHDGDALLARQPPEGSGNIPQYEPGLARVAAAP